jgi:membrane dipeptidase
MDAAELLASSHVWDMTLPWVPVYWDFDVLSRYRREGWTYASATLSNWPPSYEGTVESIARFKAMAALYEDWLVFGHSLEAIDRGREEGKLVMGINAQETRVLGGDLSRVQALYDLGVRHMLLAYNIRNLVADGCAEVADAGLSNFGRRVVRELNRVGIVVDGTHTGRRSSLEAIELSERPVIFSHVGAYTVTAHIRNIHDDQIRACADSGGVIGVVGIGAFIGDLEARTEAWFRHLDYFVERVGSEHVGIGTDRVPAPLRAFLADYDPGSDLVPGDVSWPGLDEAHSWPDPTGSQLSKDDCLCVQPEQLGELVEMMLARGYPTEAVRGILGENFRRVYRAAQPVAA